MPAYTRFSASLFFSKCLCIAVLKKFKGTIVAHALHTGLGPLKLDHFKKFLTRVYDDRKTIHISKCL